VRKRSHLLTRCLSLGTIVIMFGSSIYSESPSGAATTGGTVAASSPAATSLLSMPLPSAALPQGEAYLTSVGSSTSPVTTTVPGATSTVAPSPAAFNGCILNATGYAHLAASLGYEYAKVFESVNCGGFVQDTLSIQASIYKIGFFGPYWEATGAPVVNYVSTYDAAGAVIKCANLTQSTNFFGQAYSYATTGGVTFSATASGPSTPPLMCGTPGG
jgi:hypothetical protein